MEPDPDTPASRSESPPAGDHGSPWRLGERVPAFFRSLRGQIVLLVMLATGGSALLAAWGSADTIKDYLDQRIERRFASLLDAKGRAVDDWYRQVQLDLRSFARSATLSRDLSDIEADADGPRRREVSEFLQIVLAQFDRFRSFHLSSNDGEVLVQVGRSVRLPASVLADAGDLQGARMHGILEVQGERAQFLSVPVPDSGGMILHAGIDLRPLDLLLARGRQEDDVDVYVVEHHRAYVAGTLGERAGQFSWSGDGYARGGSIATYVNGAGHRVVGGARQLEAKGWTLVVERDRATVYEPINDLLRRVIGIDLLIAIILVAVAIRLTVSITRPLSDLSNATRSLGEGEKSVRLDEHRGALELRNLVNAFNRMTEQIGAQQQALERQNRELEQLSVTDGLTGVYNRRYLQQRLPLEVKQAGRIDRLLAFIMMDIDDFKQVNDVHGHEVGDRVLKGVAAALQSCLRETDILARYGGEEFVVLNLQETSEGATALAERVRLAVEETPVPMSDDASAETLQVTVSVGVAIHDGDTERFLQRADEALYKAKRSGKNRVVVAPG